MKCGCCGQPVVPYGQPGGPRPAQSMEDPAVTLCSPCWWEESSRRVQAFFDGTGDKRWTRSI